MSETDKHNVDRRGFLATGAAAAAAAAAGARFANAAEGSKVVIVRDKSRKVAQGRQIDADLTQKLVDRAVMTVAGRDDLAEAWGTFVRKDETVAIKFNGLFRGATTHPEVIHAVVNSLIQAGIDPDHIVVYDRKSGDFPKAGLKVNKTAPGPLFVATDGDHGPEMKAGPVKTHLSKRLLEADALINVPLLKTHVLAGISGAMKNHLGTVNNAGQFHKDEKGQNTCRFVADISALEPIKAKTRLCIADATNAQFHRGPGYSPRHRWDYCGIVASTDFVAFDTVLADLIRAKRVEKGLPPEFKPLRHLKRAVELELGCGDLEAIQRVEREV